MTGNLFQENEIITLKKHLFTFQKAILNIKMGKQRNNRH